MIENDLEYETLKPDSELSDYVESFWMIINHSDQDKEVVIMPDGRFDVFFTKSATEPFHVTLVGLGTEPTNTSIVAKRVTFAVSFKLLAAEYIPNIDISSLQNKADALPDDFWGITPDDLHDFHRFTKKVSEKIRHTIKHNPDDRKRKLFDLIYNSNGGLTVKEMSESVFWSSRQINRYFNQQFGISLKAYCNILRFKTSFRQLREGKLYPEQNFADQAHFIKDVKRFSGVAPRELNRNKNDRFIQLSDLTKE